MEGKDAFVCLVCESEFELDELESSRIFKFCPKCEKDKNETKNLISLVPLEKFLEIKRKKELAKRIYCNSCGHIGLIEEFPFNGPPEDDSRERVCPNCMSDNNVNMIQVQMCEKCDEVPAQKGDFWCKHCADEFNAACEAADDKYWRD